MLTSRQKALLLKIVREYAGSDAQPIASADLVSDFDLSSATIRNEMSQLEKMGYIYQPHISAGRIPTEAAFRFYIKESLNEKKPSAKIQQELVEACWSDDVNSTVKNLSKKMAEISCEAVMVGFAPTDVYYTGLSNLFTKPEFRDYEMMINFTRLVDHLDEVMRNIFDNVWLAEAVNSPVKIMIGKENPFDQQCSALATGYKINNHSGVLVLVGPMRMAYDNNLGLLNFTKSLIEDKFNL